MNRLTLSSFMTFSLHDLRRYDFHLQRPSSSRIHPSAFILHPSSFRPSDLPGPVSTQ
ncbi:MAG: hypothetical protein ACXW5U_06105 [Thermoanaerobaculia bacterium]